MRMGQLGAMDMDMALLDTGRQSGKHLAGIEQPAAVKGAFDAVLLVEIGLRPTPAATQKYFHSFYFRMPDGNLLELATGEPGFLVDESRDSLGQQLSLPPWLEPERATLERELAPIT